MKTVPTQPALPHTTLDADACWAAVCRREAETAGAFVYAVRTTGVYCRPTCTSRRPLRCNVEFHPDARAAGDAGFRPCKRCRPDEEHAHVAMEDSVARICRIIDDAEVTPTLAELACSANVSPSRLHRMFKATLGVTPKAYAAARRSNRARETLKRAPSITRAMLDAGYASHSAFYGDRERTLGMSASSYRRGGAGETIQHAVTPCRLGHVLAAATTRGICAILLGDQPERLVDELRRIYPHATFEKPNRRFAGLLRAVARLVDEPSAATTLPLDIRGTAFQRRVWQALLGIAPGTTVSYAELARRIGAPKAVRAVGSACAANTIAVAIPCHRVVGASGGLSGYRWGIERKRALLDAENDVAAASSSERIDRPEC